MDQKTIKNNNKKKIFNAVLNNIGISRAKIAQKLKLSKTTVSSLVDELITEGYVIDAGTDQEAGRIGRRSNSLEVSDGATLLVVNVLKASYVLTLISLRRNIISQEEVKRREHRDIFEELSEKINQCFAEFQKIVKLCGICIIIPGIIDRGIKRIYSTVLSIDKGRKETELFVSSLAAECPITFFNDTACMAYAENLSLKAIFKNYIFLNINEGIGGCFLKDGKLMNGASGTDIQLGHFSIDPNGVECRCGNRGCLENYVGEMAVRRRAEEFHCREMVEKGEYTFFMLSKTAEKEQQAEHLLEKMSEELGFALGNVSAVFHPEWIIIGGRGQCLGEKFLKLLQENIRTTGFRPFSEEVRVIYSKLDEQAVYYGVAKYFADNCLHFQEEEQSRIIWG